MVTPRPAKSLDVLLGELNARAPKRSKDSDGWIGDQAHASRTSDHNPNALGVVRAHDFTDDPNHGLDAGWVASKVAGMLGKHPALGPGAYVIFNRRIISTNRLGEGWRYYDGANAHKTHVHVSVGTSGYDSTAPWGLSPKPQVPAHVQAAKNILNGRALTKVERPKVKAVMQSQINWLRSVPGPARWQAAKNITKGRGVKKAVNPVVKSWMRKAADRARTSI